ncbi:MAG: hypothetical protein WBN65_08340 [Gammaproteobacteria bacterium]
MVGGLILALVVCAWISPIDQKASDSLEAGLARAFVTFATARGLNSAISLAQGTEVTAGVGMSATFSVGQVLDPINDLVEQFSDLMLLATVSFGVQQVLLVIGQHLLIKVLLTGLLLIWAVWYWRRRSSRPWLNGLLILLLMARFAIPLASLGTDMVFRLFLEQDYTASELALSDATTSIRSMTPNLSSPPDPDTGETPSEKGMLEQYWDQMKGAAQRLDLVEQFETLKRNAGDTVDNVVRLIVVFLLQTLVIPVAILWGLYAMVKTVVNSTTEATMRGRDRRLD